MFEKLWNIFIYICELLLYSLIFCIGTIFYDGWKSETIFISFVYYVRRRSFFFGWYLGFSLLWVRICYNYNEGVRVSCCLYSENICPIQFSLHQGEGGSIESVLQMDFLSSLIWQRILYDTLFCLTKWKTFQWKRVSYEK